MKKVLSIALALAMMLSLSVNVFADETMNSSNNNTTSTGATVYAKKITQTLSATVSWGSMYFTYDSGMGNWVNSTSTGGTVTSSTATNKFTVTNNSYAEIQVDAKYVPATNYLQNGARVFTTETLNFNVSSYDSSAELADSYFIGIGNINGISYDTHSKDFWFMFTDDPGGYIGDSFATMGTLTLQIDAAQSGIGMN